MGEQDRLDATEWVRGRYVISTDPRRINLATVHGFLATAYWSGGIRREVVARAVASSLAFGLYDGADQVGFARVVSDRATFAYVCDVFVVPGHRGQGLGIWLMETVTEHPALQGLRRWVLVTRDAHTLYRRVGFDSAVHPERYMERVDPDVYTRMERSGR